MIGVYFQYFKNVSAVSETDARNVQFAFFWGGGILLNYDVK